jgi:hypothetical protein
MSSLRFRFAVAAAIGLASVASPAGAAPRSDFEGGTLQDRVVNVATGFELTDPGSGGNPGGYALLEDRLPRGSGGVVLAPPAFLGDLRGNAKATEDILLSPQPTGPERLALSGAGSTYVFVPRRPLRVDVWHSREAPLDGGDGWSHFSGSGSFAEVLANVTVPGRRPETARVQGRGAELDNLAQVPILETGTPFLLMPGLALVALARRAARGVAGPRRRGSPGIRRLALLTGVETEGFEDKSGVVTTLDFGPDTATLSPGLEVLTIPTGTFNGVYPISGDNVLLQAVGAAESAFTITFSGPQAAFGFFATDVEFQGNLTLRFLLADGVTTLDRPVPTQAGTGVALNTGSVAYFGVIDTDNPFLAVSFVRGLNQNDGFGFDDLTIGRVENVVPEPGTLALVGLGVALVSLARRRSR